MGVKSYSVPGMPADSGRIVHNFYVDYDVESIIDYFGRTIYFDINQATLRPESKTRLDSFIPMLKENSGIGISIEGHAEPREASRNQPKPDQYLMKLGRQRALAAYTYLREKSVPAIQLISESYGGRRLAAPNSNPENRQLNRRVELKAVRVEDITLRIKQRKAHSQTDTESPSRMPRKRLKEKAPASR